MPRLAFDFDVIEKFSNSRRPFWTRDSSALLQSPENGEQLPGLEAAEGYFADPGLQIASFTITEKGIRFKGGRWSIFSIYPGEMTDNGQKMPYVWLCMRPFYENIKAGKAPLAMTS